MGKTTLLKTLMGKVPVKDGRVLLKGQDITHTTSYKRVRRGIGYVPPGARDLRPASPAPWPPAPGC